MIATEPRRGIHLGMFNRVKAQVIERGRVLRETDWQPNLILDQGMNRLATVYSADLYAYCVVGTGNTPTEDDSGVITATTSGPTCTASAPIFAAGDVNKLLRFSTGEKAYITGYTSSTVVTLGAVLAVAGATAFKMHRVAQTGLATELMRSNTLVTSAGSCFNSRAGSTVTNQRTYDFDPYAIAGSAVAATDLLTAVNNQLLANDAVVLAGGTAPSPLVLGTTYFARDIAGNDFKLAATPGGTAIDLTSAGAGFSVQLPRNFAEVGFADVATVGNNLNMRALFAAGAVTVLAGQQLRIIYQFALTVGPTAPRAKTFAIAGWPSLQQAVVADPATDTITLTDHGLTADAAISFEGTTPPAGLSFATPYFARDITTHTFKVAATVGGAAIDLTSAGSGVLLLTNTDGDEKSETYSVSCCNTPNGWREATESCYYTGDGQFTNEPSSPTYVGLSTDATFRAFPWVFTGVTSVGIMPGAILTIGMTNDAYVAGTFTRTKRATFSVTQAVNANIRSIWLAGGPNQSDGGLRCIFDTKQQKNNVSTLELVFRWTWDRVFA